MRRLVWLMLLLPVLAGAALAPGDKAYISDRLYLGVYATPGGSDRVALLSSGDALDVVEVQGDNVHVQGANGIDGWVRGSYLTADVPASVSLPAVEQENTRLKSELADAQARIKTLSAGPSKPSGDETGTGNATLAALQTQNTQLKNKLAAAQDHISTLETAAEAARRQPAPRPLKANAGPDRAGMLLATAGALGLLLGFFWGRAWYRRRLEARFGGLHPR